MLWSYEKDEGNDKAEKCVARYAASLAMHVRYTKDKYRLKDGSFSDERMEPDI